MFKVAEKIVYAVLLLRIAIYLIQMIRTLKWKMPYECTEKTRCTKSEDGQRKARLAIKARSIIKARSFNECSEEK